MLRTLPMRSGRPTVINAAYAARLLPVPAADAHKYSRGTLAVVAGSDQYPGAAIMAALAGLRSGPGYVTLMVPQSAAPVAHCHCLSVPVRATKEVAGMFCPDAVAEAAELVGRSSAAVLGPGLGRSEAAQQFVVQMLQDAAVANTPLVVDADALFALSDGSLASLRQSSPRCWVMTPHEGEAARLLGRKVQDRQADALKLAADWNATVVLKGPQTIIADPDGALFLVKNAGPELAKAGSGDVLAGIIGAMLAQGLPAVDAACLGVYLHGKAGTFAAQEVGIISVTPEDLLDFVGPAICWLGGWSPQLAAAQADVDRRSAL